MRVPNIPSAGIHLHDPAVLPPTWSRTAHPFLDRRENCSLFAVCIFSTMPMMLWLQQGARPASQADRNAECTEDVLEVVFRVHARSMLWGSILKRQESARHAVMCLSKQGSVCRRSSADAEVPVVGLYTRCQGGGWTHTLDRWYHIVGSLTAESSSCWICMLSDCMPAYLCDMYMHCSGHAHCLQ